MTAEHRTTEPADSHAETRAATASIIADSIDDGRSVSEVLREIANTWPDERISLGDFVDLFGDRGHGLLMLTFALPNLVPIYIPGLSAVTGIPAAVIALQMALGLRHPWLPGFLLRRSMSINDLRRIVERAEPWLLRIERVLQPRAEALARGVLKRLMALVCIALALFLSLPIPFTNMIFAGPLAVFALGVIQRDGVAVTVSALASVAAIVFVCIAWWGLVRGALSFVGL